MSKQRVTIKDIAKELKISTSTVSRALSDKWDVNPETRKAILDLAQKLNYRPNPMSLSLKQQHSMTVGVIVPEFINSFFPEVIMGIQSILNKVGYNILICQSNESYEKELANLKMLEEKMVDGIIVSITKETKNMEFFSTMLEKKFPIVFFNRICENLNASSIIIDDYKWAFNAVEHLIKQGCKRIIHLSGPENLLLSQQRMNGYLDALKKYGLSYTDNLIIPTGVMMECGVMAAYQILDMKKLPDAIFAINDPVAIGAMKTLQKHGIKIPEDIAVVGFTESRMAMIIEPNLTSVEQPTFEMGKLAAELLLEQLKNNQDERLSPKIITLDAKLNIRESSLKKQQKDDSYS
ncbi:LacI family DNA-binding transcriptional regulator [Bacteroides sp. AF25-38AC]|uniref:LacI family DNA-binding transcriptional regulator n=1 Tax=Bacteroides sp. AF25-38AC TaxID=2292924 RepID=UPI000E746D33|nr:LacI family DNA-binding transcriptional regulator [Bacteroides sp. AF25-38AC]RJV33112.1 LacI family transcriptional regulator [Bacteroides sp. AF25-38AC]